MTGDRGKRRATQRGKDDELRRFEKKAAVPGVADRRIFCPSTPLNPPSWIPPHPRDSAIRVPRLSGASG